MRLLFAPEVKATEIDRIEQERREAALTCQIRNQPTQEGEQEERAVDEEERLQSLLRNVPNLEQAGIDELELIEDALLVARAGPELDGALKDVLGHALGVDVHLELQIRIVARRLQQLLDVGVFERQVLDVLPQNPDLNWRWSAGAWRAAPDVPLFCHGVVLPSSRSCRRRLANTTTLTLQCRQ